MILRKAQKSDLEKIIKLYRAAAATPNGIARTQEEISQNYVADFLNNALARGLIFIAEDSNQTVAEIHCYKLEPACFKHVLSNLTLVVDPNFQAQGIGKKIFSHLIEEIKLSHPDVARVELMVRQSNTNAINLYQKLGFKIEGICASRILNSAGKLEGDTMMAWINPNYLPARIINF
jgi:ribosomal protein S18 acetylase RimI-like enzyme